MLQRHISVSPPKVLRFDTQSGPKNRIRTLFFFFFSFSASLLCGFSSFSFCFLCKSFVGEWYLSKKKRKKKKKNPRSWRQKLLFLQGEEGAAEEEEEDEEEEVVVVVVGTLSMLYSASGRE